MEKTKILYVEDELALAYIVRDTLTRNGYLVSHVADGVSAMKTYEEFNPDLCILDIMLPNIDGYTIGKQIRARNSNLPIIFLTAKDQVADVIKGFQSGGRDYLRKPFSMEELIVRINNLLTLTPKQQENQIFSIGRYQFYPKKLMLRCDSRDHKLTYRETEVLQALVANKNEIISKKKLLLDIWGDDSLSNSRNLDVYIAKLRDYLSKDPAIEIITLRSVGYRFNVEVA